MRTSTRYDGMGRVSFRSYPYNITGGEVGARFELDGLGRVVAQTNAYRPTPVDECETPGACRVAMEYLANCVKTSVDRGSDDKVTSFTCGVSFGDPEERRLTQVYDAAGGLWEYAYTAAGDLSSVTAPLEQGNRSYVYDSRQFLESETSGESGAIAFESNAVGQVTSKEDQRPVTVGFGYDDPLSRLRRVDYPGAGDDVTRNYDRANNLTHLSSENGGAFVYQYDELNRPLSQTWTYQGREYVTTYHYDADGCLDRVVYPTGTVLTAVCDSAGRPTRIEADGATVVREVSYHPTGQPSGFTYGNGLRTELSFDDRGRTTAVSSSAVDLRYGYDGADNVTSLDNLSVPDSERTMTYDAVDRLLTVTHPVWGIAAYQYDLLGNRTWGPIRDISMRFEYDERNRLAWASQELKPTSSTFEWDGANRLVASSDGATYRYDGLDRRVAKTEGGLTTVYHHDAAGRVIAETTPEGNRLRDYLYLGNKLVAVQGCMEGATSSGCSLRQWYHTDTLGSVLARTDASGAVVTRFDYKAFGEQATVTGVQGDRQYNGRVFDPGTGFHDYGARLYWPEIGRFVSADSEMGHPASPMTLNRYSYVLNNPYKYVDPDGKEVRLAFHQVIAGMNHGFVWIAPDNQAAYKDYATFSNTLKGNGKHFATLGAGPSDGILNGKLVGDANRERDIDQDVPWNGASYKIEVPEGYKNEDEFIARLMALDKAYKDDLKYAKFPGDKDDTFNSNSYAAGLLKAAGAKVPEVSQDAPGLKKPIPEASFQK